MLEIVKINAGILQIWHLNAMILLDFVSENWLNWIVDFFH